jgi:hypothetical protein
MAGGTPLMMQDEWTTTLDADYSVKPGLSRGMLNALLLCFPVSSIIWAGIIYAASKLVH